MLPVERKLVRCIHQDKTCSNIGRDNSTADYCFVFLTTAVKLPCGLEQFEELAGGNLMLRIRRDGNHVRSVITALRSPPGSVRLDNSQTAWDLFQAESEVIFIRADGFQIYLQ